MERLSTRKNREVLRLRYEAGLSGRQDAASLQLDRSSVGEDERRLAAANTAARRPSSPKSSTRQSDRPVGRSV